MTIEQVWREGRIIRGEWSREENGRQLLCLYTALAGDPEARPESCPASLCPRWLAHLLPNIDDYGSREKWPAVVERVVRLAPRFASLPPEVEWRVRALCVREAMRYTEDSAVLAICELVASLCERRGFRKIVSDADLAEAASAAWESVWSLTWSASSESAASAERIASLTAGRAASVSAASAMSVGWELASSARAEATDRLIDAILDEIERAARCA